MSGAFSGAFSGALSGPPPPIGPLVSTDDKVVIYDPPGAIGIVYSDAVVVLRFDEAEAADRPRDLAGNLTDLTIGVGTGLATPPLVPAVLGAGRALGAGLGYVATDLDPGTTLLTRDLSVQAVLSLDPVGAAGQDRGVIIARGQDTGSAGAGISYAVSVSLVDGPTNLWAVQWSWTTLESLTEIVQGAATFVPPPGAFTMITATRRWVSPTQVVLSYYIGDALIGIVTSPNGDIAGVTTHPTSVGASYDLAHAGYRHFLCGVLDEVVIVPRELCAEEIEATWLRLTLYQPLGVRAFREQFDPGFPITADVTSDAQREIALIGQALGFAAAQIENLRANFLPLRAYGSTLEQWETAMAVTPQPVQDIAARRARVVARFRQKNGISITGIGQALADLIDTDPTNLETIAYTNTITDGFDTVIDPVLWDQTPTGTAVWQLAGTARISLPLADYTLSATGRKWRTFARSISQSIAPASGVHVIAAVDIVTATDELEGGVWIGDKPSGNYLLVGLRTTAGGTTFSVVGERFVNNVSVGVMLDPRSIALANPGKIWIHAWHDEPTGLFMYAWSTTGPKTGFTVSAATLAGAPGGTWAGCYVRSLGNLAALIPLPGAGPVVDFDDFTLWTPHGVRPMNAYLYRNPLIGGAPDLAASHSVLQAIKHAYTHATIVTSRAVRCDDPASGCDRGPMGAP